MEILRKIVLTGKRFVGYVVLFILILFSFCSCVASSDTNYTDSNELQLTEIYGLVSANVETNYYTNGNLSGVYLLGSGTTSGNVETIYSPIYQYWYRRNDGGIIPDTIDFSKYRYPDTVEIVVYEDDQTPPKIEIWRNYSAQEFGDGYYSDCSTEYRFTVPKGTFVNNFDFQGISPEN